jgi:Reverse transcriptase (RNA-dependent DNA polymerase)
MGSLGTWESLRSPLRDRQKQGDTGIPTSWPPRSDLAAGVSERAKHEEVSRAERKEAGETGQGSRSLFNRSAGKQGNRPAEAWEEPRETPVYGAATGKQAMNPESSTSVLTRRWRRAEIAKQHPQGSLNSSHPYLDLDWRRVAYGQLQKDRAPGHAGETVQAYGKDLDRRLTDLLARVRAGRYHAPPVKRVHLPKGNGKETRPIGMPTTEGEVLQRAVTMLLEPIYEEQFEAFCYGVRPGRSAHQALQRIWKQIRKEPIHWIVEVDTRKFFDPLDHGRLREVLRQRVTDGVITQWIAKWLKAGVLEQQGLTYPEEGTPPGGVIAPI